MGKVIRGMVVVITGASSGIGAATAKALTREGAKLVLGARRMDRLEAVGEECRKMGGEVVTLRCDVAKREEVDALVRAAVEKFGRLDVMLANAGYGFLSRVHETKEEDFDEIVNVNVKGTWYAMQAAAKVMLPQKAGHIIVVSSAAGRRGLPLYGAYSMTKAAQLSLAEAMRVELRGTGVYASSVHPISTTTEFFEVASGRSRVKTAGVGPTQSAETVAGKIVGLIKRPRPELWPYRASHFGLAMSVMFPRIGDFIMTKSLGERAK